MELRMQRQIIEVNINGSVLYKQFYRLQWRPSGWADWRMVEYFDENDNPIPFPVEFP